VRHALELVRAEEARLELVAARRTVTFAGREGWRRGVCGPRVLPG
jgi:hypothetical protein